MDIATSDPGGGDAISKARSGVSSSDYKSDGGANRGNTKFSGVRRLGRPVPPVGSWSNVTIGSMYEHKTKKGDGWPTHNSGNTSPRA
jgi:hypothetical protein